MKKALLLFCIVLTGCFSNLFAKDIVDTTTIYYDAAWKPTQNIGVAYVSKQWKDNGLYYQNDFFYPSMKPQMIGSYADPERKKMEGTFVWYYQNGNKKDSITYVKNVVHGASTGWYESGKTAYKNHYKNGVPIDTSYEWFEGGQQSLVRICDQQGNGFEKGFLENGQTIVEGRYSFGKKNGAWTFTDKNKVVSQIVQYEADSAILITNFDEQGRKEKGNLLEKGAEFPGGLEGWRSFLEKNLRYPKSARKASIEGVVRIIFTVDKDGKVYDLKVASGPDAALEAEGLRIMSKSPNWIPAVQHNRKVTYRFVQNITFALE